MRRLVLVPLFGLALLAGASSPADGAFPGRNGLIVFASDISKLTYGEIASVSVPGGRSRLLTRDWLVQRFAVHAPRGSLIAYAGATGVLVVRDDGGGRRFVARGVRLRVPPLWSRDANRLLLVRAGSSLRASVAVVPASGGRPRPLTTCDQDYALASCADWSPDGRRVVVARGGDLYVVRVADGRSTRLTTRARASTPRWSPTDDAIAYCADGRLALVRPGRPGDRYTSFPCSHTAWSPDGRRIAVVGADALAVLTDSLTRPHRIKPQAGFGLPVWSPNGSSLAYVSGDDAWLVTPPARPRRLEHDDGSIETLSWRPDGRALIIGLHSDGGGDHELFTVAPRGGPLHQLTEDDVGDVGPAWSPDGSMLAWSCGRNLCLIRSDGTGRRTVGEITSTGAPAWSPDGSQLAVQRDDGLFVVGADGRGIRRLTWARWPTRHRSAAWSPDGRTIAFTDSHASYPYPHARIALRDVATGETRRLGSGTEAQFEWDPSWSPDGRVILHMGEDSCCPPDDVVYIRSESTLSIRARFVYEPAWSPDGRLIVATAGAGVVVYPVAGGRRHTLFSAGSHEVEVAGPDWQPLCTKRGGGGADVLRGGGPLVCGRGGDDHLTGGRQADRLFGGTGDDRIDARGGGFDVVGCGLGQDRALADRGDLVGVDCESVTVG